MSGSLLDPAVVAALTGLEVVLPGPDELQLDLDDEQSIARMTVALQLLSQNGEEVLEVKRTTSKSGNTHVYLRLPYWGQLDPVMRVALQACFGSDRTRELLSLLRIRLNDGIPATVLFEVPQ